MMFKTWEDAAKFCEETFGSYVDWEDEYFLCPECAEPIYSGDWEDINWSMCPVCETGWEEIE